MGHQIQPEPTKKEKMIADIIGLIVIAVVVALIVVFMKH